MGNNDHSDVPSAPGAAPAPVDIGSALNDLVHGISGSANAGGPGAHDVISLAAHSVGDLVASIASFDPSNPHSAVDHLGSEPGAGAAGDALHGVGHVDLSDVGSILSHAGGDVASSNMDLDHLTSNVNLFDVGHVDTGFDGGHHS
jgi:hypothetical protein